MLVCVCLGCRQQYIYINIRRHVCECGSQGDSMLPLLTLGLSAWCAPFCTSKAGTASCLCPAESQCASWALPGEALQREDAGQPWQRDRQTERERDLSRFRHRGGRQTHPERRVMNLEGRVKVRKERNILEMERKSQWQFWFLHPHQVLSLGPLCFTLVIFYIETCQQPYYS